MTADQKMALAGIKVLDLSRILAGPSAAQLLGDLGADVVKVEKPDEGDDTRKWGPPYVRGTSGEETDESAYYLSANRNKRSIAIDIGSDSGRELVHRLIAQADVLVENYKVGGLAKYGLAYEQIKDRYPRLIYCSVTGFGQTGPYAPRPGYDFLIQGMGGIMSLTGVPDGEPMKVGVGIADVMTGMYATVGILAALHHRQQTGEGQHIDISLLDTQISWLVNAGTNYLADRQVPSRLGNGHPNIVPYQVFSTADAPMILAVGNDAQFRRFCEVAGIDALASDERFATNPMRIRHRVELCELVDKALRSKHRVTWLQELEAVGVPCGPVNNLEDVFADPHVKARGAELHMPCEWAMDGEIRLLANPLKMSATPPSYRRPPPRLDEHAEEVLMDWLENNQTF
ncbi:CoA transferase [Burkholderia cepacia]|uniref:CaiB/BaiF CoA transferase family protein n=1 Tax=Burkholderia cepacia TaxID=292 RepID=UPI000F594882|nr:CaiB/BaiF CoA-transferase family protein [Burkholderia cepacia]RQU90584.1 CoA transferase [Burkholderia cenocepacia]RQV30331.1 CoA transferase [Burkholderia cenocepacia]RQV88840.1 CoA transferase [Burkholderia cenocepacia]RQZ91050.1 CoA transferase [Burkholderia cepacia]RQZ98421.1 CoA transferase [Burkholderia cenocepacia]